MSNISTNTPTIPIKQVTQKKFVPLVVGSSNSELKIQAKLFEDQKLQNFIKDILEKFDTIKEKNPTLYGIRQCSTNQYINERNRNDLLSLNDQIRFHEVELCFNLETEVRTYVEKITSLKLTNPDVLINHLISIEKFIASDRIFAFEFYAKGGKKLMIDYIKECDRASDAKKWNLLYHFYKILILFIKNWSLISWDMSEIDLPIIKLICDTLNDSTKENKKSLIPDHLVLLFLQIADDVINNSNLTRELMLKELKFNDIIFVVQRQDILIREALLIFLNSCYKKGNEQFISSLNSILIQPLMSAVLREELRRLCFYEYDLNNNDPNFKMVYDNEDLSENLLFNNSLSENEIKNKRKYSKNFFTKILNSSKKSTEKDESQLKSSFYLNACKDDRNVENIFYNFALLQKNILDNDLGIRIKTPAESSHMFKIKSIFNSAFECTTGSNMSEKIITDEEKCTKLGFMNVSNPIEDFKQTPPGVLALDFMEYFAANQALRTLFQNFVSEKINKNSDYKFPFAKASIYMVKFLCDLLDIGEKNELNKQNEILYIIFTINLEGIFDFFAKCLWLFQRLWIEMRAQSLDFDRALSALKDSLYKILMDVNKIDANREHMNILTYSSLIKRKITDFNNLIDTWKYDFIKNIKHRFDKFNLEPIKELRKILTQEVIQKIRPRRLHVLCKGEIFEKMNLREKRSKQKQLWKLSTDFKTFHISDCDYNQSEIKNTNQIEVDRIKDVRKEEIRRQERMFVLNITCKRLDEQGDESILLTNQNEDIIDSWHDGISILINPKPTPDITCYIECLIDVQLLDIHTLGYEIPYDIPKIPQLPSNFDFVN